MDKINHCRDAIIDEQHKAILIWTPKAGCTLGISIMFQHMGVFQTALTYKRKGLHGYRVDVHYRTTGFVDYNKHLLSKQYRVLKLIRNPYDRAVSQYLFCMRVENLTDSFKEYLQILKQHSMSYVVHGKSHSLITKHSIVQYITNEEQYVTDYLHLETIQSDLQRVNQKYGWSLSIPLNVPTGHHVPRDDTVASKIEYLGNTPFPRLPKKVPSSYDCFYNSETSKLVEELYVDDFSHYQSYQLTKADKSGLRGP